MALGNFTAPPSQGKASQYKPQEKVGRPIIAVPREFKTDFVTPQYPTAKDVVIYDVVDLLTGEILPSVITGSGAMVTRLQRYVPGGVENQSADPMPLPVKIVKVERQGKNDYYSVEQLEGQELQLAQMWDQKFGIAAIDAKRAEFAAEQQAQNTTTGNGQPAWAQQSGGGNLAGLNGGGNAAAPAPQQEAPAASNFNDADLAAAIANLKPAS
jgi:hypothetical protein